MYCRMDQIGCSESVLVVRSLETRDPARERTTDIGLGRIFRVDDLNVDGCKREASVSSSDDGVILQCNCTTNIGTLVTSQRGAIKRGEGTGSAKPFSVEWEGLSLGSTYV